MKKTLLASVTASFLLLGLAACNNGSAGSASPDPGAKGAASGAAASTASAKPAASAAPKASAGGGGW